MSAAPEHRSLRFLADTGSPEPLLRRPRSGTSIREGIESEGPRRKMSVTHRNSAQESLKEQGPLRKENTAGALSPVCGPTRASFSPPLFTISLFLFLLGLEKS
jgi:hypothetical protein